MKLDIPYHDEVCEFTSIKEQPLTSLELKITKQFGTIVKKFKILYCGWEMDSCGYIVNDGSVNKIIVTNHCQPMVVDSSYLNAKIREYGDAILETNEAIKISQNGKP
jgi:hypothetical protein